jgi:type IV secretion system protein VirD4
MPIWVRIVIAGTVSGCAFVVAASALFLTGAGLWGAYGSPFPLAWPEYLIYARGNPIAAQWLLASAVPATALPLAVLIIVGWRWRHVRGWSLRWSPRATQPLPDPMRSPTDNHGHARLATIRELEQLWPGPDPAYGGLVVGEKYDPRQDHGPFDPDPKARATWGQGGKTGLLIDPCHQGSTHALLFAASGFFKTVSLTTMALHWTGSMVVLDPSEELAPMLEADRHRLGHRTFVLSPDRAAACGFDALGWIDINSPIAETDIASVTEWICGPPPPRADATAAFFASKGRALITCLLAQMLYDSALPPELKTLKALRAGLSFPESVLRDVLRRIYKTSPSTLARSLAGPLCELTDATYSGVIANADDMTRFLAVSAFADLVSGTSFRADDIADGRTDVFIAIPLKALISTPALARCIVGALLNAVYERNGAIRGRVCVMLDEMARLGPMEILKVARDCDRKYGITLVCALQSEAQLGDAWGGKEGAAAWLEAVSWRSYAAIKDLDTAKAISETIGNYGVLGWSQNDGRHGRALEMRSRSTGTTYTEQSRPLLRAEEIMHDLRSDAQIVIPKNARPALIGRALYFKRPALDERVAKNRFAAKAAP